MDQDVGSGVDNKKVKERVRGREREREKEKKRKTRGPKLLWSKGISVIFL